MLVSDVMTEAVISVGPQDGAVAVARTLSRAGVHAVPVLSAGGVLLGAVSEADLLPAAARAGGPEPQPWWRPRHSDRPDPKEDARTAEQLMATAVETVRPWTRVAVAARRMRAGMLRWMPVTTPDGRVVGILSRSDVLSVFLRPDEEIRARIRRDVFRTALAVDPATVVVEVADGVVTLTGELGTRVDVSVAQQLVEGIDGVVAVVNQLTHRVAEQGSTVPPD